MSRQEQVMMQKGYLSASAIARKVGLSPASVAGWIARGQVQHVRIGRRKYVLIKSVVSYLGADAAKLLGVVA